MTQDKSETLLGSAELMKYGLGDNDQQHLAELNDSGKNFKEIAAWIVENVAKEGS